VFHSIGLALSAKRLLELILGLHVQQSKRMLHLHFLLDTGVAEIHLSLLAELHLDVGERENKAYTPHH
jgi:hypothetical protein